MLIFNFHGIGSIQRNLDPGEEKYWITKELFLKLLDLFQNEAEIQITFDDGNESDHSIALPALQDRNLKATFFVLSGKFDQPSYLSCTQIQEMNQTMEIGTHGIDHISWKNADPVTLSKEIFDSKHQIEQLLQQSIHAAAIPFGDYNRRTLKFLKKAGFSKVYSSDRYSTKSENWFNPRFSITAEDTTCSIKEIIKLYKNPGYFNFAPFKIFLKKFRP